MDILGIKVKTSDLIPENTVVLIEGNLHKWYSGDWVRVSPKETTIQCSKFKVTKIPKDTQGDNMRVFLIAVVYEDGPKPVFVVEPRFIIAKCRKDADIEASRLIPENVPTSEVTVHSRDMFPG